MPLSEFLRLAMEKLESSKHKSCSTDHSSRKENNFVEFDWENGPAHHCFSPNTPSFPDSATASLGGMDLSSVAPSGPLDYHSECSPQDYYVPSGPTMASFEDTFMETDKALAQSNIENSTVVLDGDTSALAYEQKRKLCDIESECRDDIQHEFIGVKKQCSGSKRSRTTEVHNLSERRRRDRINEKMRALQQLIPNSNKVDKASMLDDAIQYLKNLQYQLHIMSMGGCIQPAPVPHFSPMSFGNISGFHPRPICPVPPFHFPGSTLVHVYIQGISSPHFPIHGPHPSATTNVIPLAPSSTQNKVSTRSSNLDFEDPLSAKNSTPSQDHL